VFLISAVALTARSAVGESSGMLAGICRLRVFLRELRGLRVCGRGPVAAWQRKLL